MTEVEAAEASVWSIGSLALIAGSVDAVGYQVLGHVYVSNMTGNAGGLGISLATGQLLRALERGFPLLPFFAGVMLGTALVGGRGGRGPGRGRARLLGVELLLVGATAAAVYVCARHPPLGWRSAGFYVVATLAAGSMGVQNALSIATDWRGGPFTTHITGALTQLAHAVAAGALGHGGGGVQRPLALVAGFIVGAATAMLLFEQSPFAASAAPLPVLAALWARELATGPISARPRSSPRHPE